MKIVFDREELIKIISEAAERRTYGYETIAHDFPSGLKEVAVTLAQKAKEKTDA